MSAQPTQFKGVYATLDTAGRLRVVDGVTAPAEAHALSRAFTADCDCGCGGEGRAPAAKPVTTDVSPKQIAANFATATRALAAKAPQPSSFTNIVATDTPAAIKGRADAERVNAAAERNPLRNFNETARNAWKGNR